MYCTKCSNEVSKLNSTCATCGYRANSSNNYCYNCGRENQEDFLICQGCKTQFEAKQNPSLFVFLTVFGLLPFHVLYAGKYKQALIRIGIFLLSITFFGIGVEKAIFGNYLSNIYGILGFFGYFVLIIWWFLDIAKAFFEIPGPYVNSKGLPIM